MARLERRHFTIEDMPQEYLDFLDREYERAVNREPLWQNMYREYEQRAWDRSAPYRAHRRSIETGPGTPRANREIMASRERARQRASTTRGHSSTIRTGPAAFNRAEPTMDSSLAVGNIAALSTPTTDARLARLRKRIKAGQQYRTLRDEEILGAGLMGA